MHVSHSSTWHTNKQSPPSKWLHHLSMVPHVRPCKVINGPMGNRHKSPRDQAQMAYTIPQPTSMNYSLPNPSSAMNASLDHSNGSSQTHLPYCSNIGGFTERTPIRLASSQSGLPAWSLGPASIEAIKVISDQGSRGILSKPRLSTRPRPSRISTERTPLTHNKPTHPQNKKTKKKLML